MADREFEYRLNRMEAAVQAESPFEAGYADARRAVFEYVESLRQPPPLPLPLSELRERLERVRERADRMQHYFPPPSDCDFIHDGCTAIRADLDWCIARLKEGK